jgi:hypothetical protein
MGIFVLFHMKSRMFQVYACRHRGIASVRETPTNSQVPWWKVTCLARALYNEKVHLVDVIPADLPFPADTPKGTRFTQEASSVSEQIVQSDLPAS